MIINFLNFANSILAGFIKFIQNLLLKIYCFYWLSAIRNGMRLNANETQTNRNKSKQIRFWFRMIQSDSEGPEIKSPNKPFSRWISLNRQSTLTNRMERLSFDPDYSLALHPSALILDSGHTSFGDPPLRSSLELVGIRFRPFISVQCLLKKTLDDYSKCT